MRKKIILSIIAITLLFAYSCKNTKKKPSEKNRITVGYLNMVSSLTHFVAIEKGFYKEQKLDVRGTIIKTSNLIAQEVATGHIDIGIELSIIPLLKQLERMPNAAKIYAISSITKENGFDGVIVAKNSNYQDLKDLAGKKVGGFPGTTAKKSFLQVFKQKYPDLKIPTFIELSPNLHIQALSTGEIDALFAYEPILSTGKIKYQFKQIYPSIYGTQQASNPIGVSAINTSFLTENPALAKRFLAAIDKAISFIEAHPKEAKIILSKATNIKEEVALAMNILPLSKSDEIKIDHLDTYLQLLLKLDEIKKLPKANELCIKQ